MTQQTDDTAPQPQPGRLTRATLAVLAVLDAAGPDTELCGSDLARRANLTSVSTVYPILARLSAAGWVCDHWENGDPADMSQPRRHFYRLSPAGANAARAALVAAASALTSRVRAGDT